MKNWWGLVGITLLFALVALSSPRAEDIDQDAVEMEPVVVTATGTEVPLQDSTQAVTVITEKQIEQQQAVRVEEVLRFVPGVTVNQSGSRGGLTELFLRGGESDQTQVLFNGMRINDAGGAFNFNALTTDNLSRIEVVRGPMSALYGADAVVGVVNLMTRKGVGPPTLNLSAGAGFHAEKGANIEEYRASLLGSYKKFGFSIGWTRLNDPGILRVNNQFRSNALVARLDWDPLDNLSIIYHTLLLNSRFEFPTENGGDRFDVKEKKGPGLDPDQNNSKLDLLQGLVVDYWPFQWWQNQLTLALSHRDRHFDDPANPPKTTLDLLVAPHNSQFDLLFGSFNTRDLERRWSLDYRANFRIGSREKLESIFTFGFYAREEQLKQWTWLGGNPPGTLNPFPFPPSINFIKARRGATAYYAQEQLNLWNRVFLVGGFRVENSSVFDSAEFVPRGSAAVHFPETNTTLRAAGGRAIKEPTFVESFSRTQLSLPNPNLRPERNVSWEVGLDQSFFDNNVRFSFTYFENYFNDFITFVPRTFPELSSFENIGAVRVAGIESYLWLRPEKGFTVRLTYTNLFTAVTDDGDIDNLFFQAGKPLLRRPRHTFSFVANYTRDRLNVNLNGYYSHWRDDSKFTFEFPFLFQSERVDNPDYFVLNLAANYDVVRDWGYAKKIQLWIRLNNLLDERYEETFGFSSPGFSMLGGLRVIFGLTPQPGEKTQVSPAPLPVTGGFSQGLSAYHWRGNHL
jgi:vitamin B12 transporter